MIRLGCGSDAAWMWFRYGADVARTRLGHAFGCGTESLAEVKGNSCLQHAGPEQIGLTSYLVSSVAIPPRCRQRPQFPFGVQKPPISLRPGKSQVLYKGTQGKWARREL